MGEFQPFLLAKKGILVGFFQGFTKKDNIFRKLPYFHQKRILLVKYSIFEHKLKKTAVTLLQALRVGQNTQRFAHQGGKILSSHFCHK